MNIILGLKVFVEWFVKNFGPLLIAYLAYKFAIHSGQKRKLFEHKLETYSNVIMRLGNFSAWKKDELLILFPKIRLLGNNKIEEKIRGIYTDIISLDEKHKLQVQEFLDKNNNKNPGSEKIKKMAEDIATPISLKILELEELMKLDLGTRKQTRSFLRFENEIFYK